MGHLKFIRAMNRSLVLQAIRGDQPVSRGQLAERLGLGKSTVAAVVEDLVELGLVDKVGQRPAHGSGGRPAPLYGFNPRSRVGLGVDIGSRHTYVLLADLDGEQIAVRSAPTTNVAADLVDLIRETLNDAGVDQRSVLGVGVGVPGTVDGGRVIRSNTLSWTNYDLGAVFGAEFDFPATLSNDVNNAALGERWRGAADGRDDLLFISLGDGVGAAVVAGGRVVSGTRGRAGEIGYNVSLDDIRTGEANMTGRAGVLERRLSLAALVGPGETAQGLFEQYSRGDSPAVEAVNSVITELSVVIANAVNLLNPATVVLGGELADAMGPVLPLIQEAVTGLTPIRTHVRLAGLGRLAGAYGGVALAMSQVELGFLADIRGDDAGAAPDRPHV